VERLWSTSASDYRDPTYPGTVLPGASACTAFLSSSIVNGLPSTAVAFVAASASKIGRAGHDSNRDPLVGELVEQHLATLAAEMHVEQHHVDALGHLPSSLVERACLTYLVAAKLEIHPTEQANRRFVVDHENDLSAPACRHKTAVY